MHLRLASAARPLTAVLVLFAAAACGGKVIVDQPGAGGNGGNGGSTSHGPTSTVSTIAGPTTATQGPIGEGPITTVGSGPSCDCNTACQGQRKSLSNASAQARWCCGR